MSRAERDRLLALTLLANGYGSALLVGAFRIGASALGVAWPGDVVSLVGAWAAMTIATCAACLVLYGVARVLTARLLGRAEPAMVSGVVLALVGGPLVARWVALALGLASV